ncbi:ferric uptake regulator, Fur family [Thermodesulfatator indicus DSM 15286]|uniref:Ferric uptake regulation protein n=1 Tax=Thermodesulfatator indicus (strain DSM 15286 / JCM 11887 / CIR29812) TaxID=667014 RepID=F8A8H3_THEID|nr:transcriptional repressor [Thermodesulfatator indicus]AEH43983.1 ferric uptake regulator, Fur family [Thermodesulfatator indicus DSM 15286]
MTKEKIEYYRKLGLKMTPQRLAILEFLDGNTSHPSAEDIYRHVEGKFPSMSFATVYNTLEALKEKGLIRELSIEPGKKRFDPNPSPHHHFICERCHQVYDIFEDFQINLPEEYQKQFEIRECEIIFRGICADCKRKEV